MLQFVDEAGIPVIKVIKNRKNAEFITCDVVISFQKDPFDYIPIYNVSVSLDFSRECLCSFVKQLELLRLFEIDNCCLNDVENSIRLKLTVSKDTGHITCSCIVGNENYGVLSFKFGSDQTMISDWVLGIMEIIE